MRKRLACLAGLSPMPLHCERLCEPFHQHYRRLQRLVHHAQAHHGAQRHILDADAA